LGEATKKKDRELLRGLLVFTEESRRYFFPGLLLPAGFLCAFLFSASHIAAALARGRRCTSLDPRMNPLRSDPRFQEIARKVAVPRG